MWRLLSVSLALLICVKDSLSHLDEFGHPFLNPRIVGGQNTDAKSWPWMVSLNYASGEHFCGGSLLTNEWVLTAAHCVKGEDMSNLRAHLGKTKQKGTDSKVVIMKIKEIIMNDKYDEVTDDNDIALLHLSATLTLNEYIKTVSLADEKSVFATNTKSVIIGWGRIGENIPLPSPGILQKATVEVYENSDCDNLCRGKVTDNMICAGLPKGGRDTWKGDSGGPMMSEQCTEWIQSGITSWGERCAKPNKPAVYTRVSKYKKWIEGKIGLNKVKFVLFPKQCPSASHG